MNEEFKGQDSAPRFDMGDIAVIVTAAMCTLGFFLILFTPWHLQELANGIKLVAAPTPAKVQPKGETEMLLFSAPPPGRKH